MSDYVVAQGASNGWNYIKFNSGIAICSYEGTGTETHYCGQYASWFYGYTSSVAYPFTFVETPAVAFAVQIGSGFATHCNVSAYCEYLSWVALSNVSGLATYQLQGIVIGKWK